ncbi:MAG: hypothetical protein HYY22_09490 [Thaumarchaeota archaeon]|nr:hypothetical protein [Nitrososphaerota archaeon]
MVPEAAFALEPQAPGIYIMFRPGAQLQLGDKCPAAYTTVLFSNPDYTYPGDVKLNLTVPDLPRGVTAALVPNQIIVQPNNGNRSLLMVTVSPDAPKGTYALHVKATLLRGSNNSTRIFYNGPAEIPLTISSDKCEQPASGIETITLTVTATSISTTTLIETATKISLQPVTDASTYGWAIGATAAAVILALGLLLQRRTR